jgi:arsenite methyltransferase
MAPDPAPAAPSVDDLLRLDLPLDCGDPAACCAALYEHPGVRWLLGGELHPGGPALTRRAFELLGLGADDRLLDVASGDGSTVILAAAERGCSATGVEYGERLVEEARRRADARGLGDGVDFVRADARSLPFADGTFEAAISECALCVFRDKAAAIGEIRRVLRPGGRVAISDVVADVERLPPALRGQLGAVACVGDALAPGVHGELLSANGFEVLAEEDRSGDALGMATRITDRLRGAKVLGLDALTSMEGGVLGALEAAAEARAAIADGRIGYTLVSALVPRDGEGP